MSVTENQGKRIRRVEEVGRWDGLKSWMELDQNNQGGQYDDLRFDVGSSSSTVPDRQSSFEDVSSFDYSMFRTKVRRGTEAP